MLTLRVVDEHIPFAKYPGAGAFLAVYSADYPRVASWFHCDPHDDSCIEVRIADLLSGKATGAVPTERREAADAAHAQQQRWHGGEQSQAAALRLASANTFTVATGQQVGLFGGPLYAVLKAISAVQLAEQLRQSFPQHGFVPVFWMGSADSDYEEVRRTWLIGNDGGLTELALPAELDAEQGVIVGRRDVSAHLSTALSQAEAVLMSGAYRDDVLHALRKDYGDGGLVEGFARWMARLFRGTDLVLLDPQDATLMQAARPLIRHELKTSAEVETKLLQRNAEISAAGLTPQVAHLAGDTGLFLLDDAGRRSKIVRADSGFVLKQTREHYALDALLAICDATPERFVLGVELRPLYQNMLFPAAAFLGGGAELAYRAQMTVCFEHHGQRMAPAFPRASATLLSAKQAALLDEHHLSLTDCYATPEQLVARVVAGDRVPEITESLTHYRALLLEADNDLEALAVQIDASLATVFTTLRGNLDRHVDKLEKKITSALKRKNDELVARINRVQTAVVPRQAAQERALPMLNFLPRYGFEIVGKLCTQLATPCWEHQIIVLD